MDCIHEIVHGVLSMTPEHRHSHYQNKAFFESFKTSLNSFVQCYTVCLGSEFISSLRLRKIVYHAQNITSAFRRILAIRVPELSCCTKCAIAYRVEHDMLINQATTRFEATKGMIREIYNRYYVVDIDNDNITRTTHNHYVPPIMQPDFDFLLSPIGEHEYIPKTAKATRKRRNRRLRNRRNDC